MILGLFFLGVWMVDLDYYSHWYHRAPNLHKSFGLILLTITFFRLIWILINPKPASLSNIRWQQTLASLIHFGFYILLATLFLSGYIIATADGGDVYLFEFIALPAIITGNESLVEPMGKIHEYCAYLLLSLIFVHILGALKQHFIEKNATIKRMLSPKHKT
jgi:cytochrome b561